jgi:membrane protease YdiL (CAAX protease family)
MRLFRAIGLTLVLFLAVYAPATALAAILHFQLAAAVPFVMLLTLVTAGVLLRLMAGRTPDGLARYGVRLPERRHLAEAVFVAAPAAVVTALLLTRVHEAGPLAGLSLAPWLVVLYFAAGAPIQEEIIFRGLLQTTLAAGITPQAAADPKYGVGASVLVALLFGCVHLAVGRYTAIAAFVLGSIAGELRRRSGSLVPAIVCHALFNLGAIIWP